MTLLPTPLQVEKWLPTALGVLSGLVWWALGFPFPVEIAGFLLLGVIVFPVIGAVLLSVKVDFEKRDLRTTRIGRQIERRGKLPYLYRYFDSAIISCMGLGGICLLMFFQISESGLPVWASALFSGAVVFSAAAIWRVIRISVKLIKALSEPEDSPE